LAIGLWSALALLTKFAGAIPPFELLSLSFSVAFIASAMVILRKGRAGIRSLRQPWPAWVCSFIGIFAYHALYFFALGAAPAAQVSLINYLWPLLIVLFSTLSRKRRAAPSFLVPLGGRAGRSPALGAFITRSGFQSRQLLGALLGFLGIALVIFSGDAASMRAGGAIAGYLAAAGCALVWSLYSVANRRFLEVPSDLIGGVCALVAIAGACFHIAIEQTVWPTGHQWVAILLLGIGPVGLAFFAWDHATKHGHVALLGAIGYVAPLLSTFFLVLFGFVPASWNIIIATILIVAGSAVAALKGCKTK
jgi:drug/metabolite transporter (DMT)-like permease